MTSDLSKEEFEIQVRKQNLKSDEEHFQLHILNNLIENKEKLFLQLLW